MELFGIGKREENVQGETSWSCSVLQTLLLQIKLNGRMVCISVGACHPVGITLTPSHISP